jgi:hypothetical protein
MTARYPDQGAFSAPTPNLPRPPAWSYVAASVRGTSHARRELACQDVHACELLEPPQGAPVLVAIVADGAGSARRAEVGAQATCSWFLSQVRGLIQSGGAAADISRGRVEIWLAGLHKEIERLVEESALLRRDFASTLVAAVVDSDAAVFFQVGDGAVVIASPGPETAYRWIFWPGDDADRTVFATEPSAVESLGFLRVEGAIDEFAVFTDGLQRLALDFETRTAHTRFFDSMLSPLRGSDPARATTRRLQLEEFLQSPRVNDRTDDDKTLVLATLRAASGAS